MTLTSSWAAMPQTELIDWRTDKNANSNRFKSSHVAIQRKQKTTSTKETSPMQRQMRKQLSFADHTYNIVPLKMLTYGGLESNNHLWQALCKTQHKVSQMWMIWLPWYLYSGHVQICNLPYYWQSLKHNNTLPPPRTFPTWLSLARLNGSRMHSVYL